MMAKQLLVPYKSDPCSTKMISLYKNYSIYTSTPKMLVEERHGNLFDAPENVNFAHCVSRSECKPCSNITNQYKTSGI